MGKGSSGGPWLLTYAPYYTGKSNYVNGVTSVFFPTRKKDENFTPYFGDGAKNLYTWGKKQ